MYCDPHYRLVKYDFHHRVIIDSSIIITDPTYLGNIIDRNCTS